MSNAFLSESCNQYLRPLFPELTEKQFLFLFYYSLGFTSDKIGLILGCSSKTVRNQVQLMKDRLSLDSASDLRIVFLTRVITPRENHI